MSEEHKENHCHCCEHEHDMNKYDIYKIIAGTAIFLFGIILQKFFVVNDKLVFAIYMVSYLITGYEVLIHAVKHILKGKIFDENFLMSLSSIAAICIKSYSEAAAIMLFYNIGEYLQGIAVKKSKKSIADLMDINTDLTTVIRNGKALTVKSEEVDCGETILIKAGEKIPMDCTVLKGKSQIDASALTGEARLFSAEAGTKLLSGAINKSGSMEARVDKIFSESTASKIIKMVEEAAEKKAPSEKFITSFSKIYTPIVVILALIIAVFPAVIFGNWAEWIRRGCVFLVISCPCALVISVPLTFFGAIGAASKKGILIRGGNYIEILSKVKTVVFDKTGTLTKGSFGVSKLLPENGHTEEELLKTAAEAEQISNHPIALSILKSFNRADSLPEVLEANDISGKGLKVKTAEDEIIIGSEKLIKEYGVKIEDDCGYETIVYVLKNKEYIGKILLSDTVKSSSRSALKKLKEIGIRENIILTGDVYSSAKSVSNMVGTDKFYAELLPQDKVSMFEKIKKLCNGKVAFVGDGINDAPVLAISDIGIAMGGIGTDAAIEAADMVIMNDDLTKIADAVKLAKETQKIAVQNIYVSLGIKLAFLFLGALGVAGMWEAVFGDVGVMLLAVLNSMRILKK